MSLPNPYSHYMIAHFEGCRFIVMLTSNPHAYT
jgi:hypothetical protein